MLRIDNLKLPVGADKKALRAACERALHVSAAEISSVQLLRRSIDAREGVKLVCSCAVEVKNETAALKRCKNKNVQSYAPRRYAPPAPIGAPAVSPVVVGAGPAGLFCALLLARCGARPILLERGRAVEQRKQDVERFWHTGELDLSSNVQFGEGGAGAFSDGKLNTGTKDLRHGFILEEFVRFGASGDILLDAKPHVGTDRLYIVLQNLRREIIDRGGEVRFSHRVTDIDMDGGSVRALRVSSPEGDYVLPARHVVLAPGHSARDTFEMLRERGVPMEPKPFSMGVRIEHPQRQINENQYGPFADAPGLGAADYKLNVQLPSGGSAYTFCMCPGGYVVAAASEPGGVVTNGMSDHARDGENANAALLVTLNPADFPDSSPLGGMYWQRQIEQAAFRAGGCNYRAPAQLVGDFLKKQPSQALGAVQPAYRPGVTLCELHEVLPERITSVLEQALPELDKRLHGFARPDAVLTAPETRSSSPVRILRDETRQSSLRGLYPCGEGAGYAGGITSAALDGMLTAEAIINELSNLKG